MTDDLEFAKEAYQKALKTDPATSLEANKYIVVLETEHAELTELFEHMIGELEEMNKTQAEDIRTLIAERRLEIKEPWLRKALVICGYGRRIK